KSVVHLEIRSVHYRLVGEKEVHSGFARVPRLLVRHERHPSGVSSTPEKFELRPLPSALGAVPEITRSAAREFDVVRRTMEHPGTTHVGEQFYLHHRNFLTP